VSHSATRCTSPIGVYWPALCTYIYTRCRWCEGCMRARQWAWVSRAAHEQVRAKTTWFITLTYGPNRRRAVMAAAMAADRHKGSEERLVAAAGTYVTTYMKTLRKRGFEFRYLCVPELHRDGFPHFHGLIHDQVGNMTWNDVASAWSAGFSVVKVVRDARALRYVTKYLGKAKLGRVRASLKYGASLMDEDCSAGLQQRGVGEAVPPSVPAPNGATSNP